MTEHPSDGSTIEQVGIEFHSGTQSVRVLSHGQRQIKLCYSRIEREWLNRQIPNPYWMAWIVSELEHDLEKRVAAQFPFRLQLLNQLFER